MSEQTQNSQQTIVIGLVVIAVLLAAIVGVLIYQQSQAVPEPTVTGAPAGQTGATQPPAGMGGAAAGMGGAAGGTGGAPAGMGGNAAAPTAFDPKTATKVPAGMTPEAVVKAYLAAVVAGKYEDAYKMLPVDTQKNYGDANAYAAQVKAYGITSGETGKPVENGDTVTVVATQVTWAASSTGKALLANRSTV